MLKNIKAFIFDLNGTMIDDMAYHTEAWLEIINNDLGGSLSREEVKVQMYGKNEEVLARIFGEGYFTPEKAAEISVEKERRYQKTFLPHLSLLSGLHAFLDEAKAAGVLMAIGSAAITFNIDFVLDNLQIRHYFNAIVSADDVAISKPNPETFIKCAQLLGVLPAECIVFEDAPKGVEAAENAEMPSVVLTTTHEAAEFSQYQHIKCYLQNYEGIKVEDLL